MSAHESGQAVMVERVQLRRISPTFGFASIRIPGANLASMKIQEGPDGGLTFTAPDTLSQGKRWPAWSLQPHWREAVEAEIACLWARSA